MYIYLKKQSKHCQRNIWMGVRALLSVDNSLAARVASLRNTDASGTRRQTIWQHSRPACSNNVRCWRRSQLRSLRGTLPNCSIGGRGFWVGERVPRVSVFPDRWGRLFRFLARIEGRRAPTFDAASKQTKPMLKSTVSPIRWLSMMQA